jgi:hypothetical protein
MIPSWCAYRGGRFVGQDPPSCIDEAPKDDDWAPLLAGLGYLPSQEVGDDTGLSYTLYEGKDGWIVCFCTAGRCVWIVCDDWPDLIGILSKLSAIALSGLINKDYPDKRPWIPVRAIKP